MGLHNSLSLSFPWWSSYLFSVCTCALINDDAIVDISGNCWRPLVWVNTSTVYVRLPVLQTKTRALSIVNPLRANVHKDQK